MGFKTRANDSIHSYLCVGDKSSLWEDGIVPYKIVNLSYELSLYVKNAMQEISNVSIIRFVKKTNQRSFITIVDDGVFSSEVGMKGHEQRLSVTLDLYYWPKPLGSVIHELMHALGFFHEHCRLDSNRHVIVTSEDQNYNIIYNGKSHGPYDEDSKTLYSKLWGVESILEDIGIGQRKELSSGDIFALNKLYPPEICISRLMKFLRISGKREIENRTNYGSLDQWRSNLMASLSASEKWCMDLLSNNSKLVDQELVDFDEMKNDTLRKIDQRIKIKKPHIQDESYKKKKCLLTKMEIIFKEQFEEIVQSNISVDLKRLEGIENDITSLQSAENELVCLRQLEQWFDNMRERLFQNNLEREGAKHKKSQERRKKIHSTLSTVYFRN